VISTVEVCRTVAAPSVPDAVTVKISVPRGVPLDVELLPTTPPVPQLVIPMREIATSPTRKVSRIEPRVKGGISNSAASVVPEKIESASSLRSVEVDVVVETVRTVVPLVSIDVLLSEQVVLLEAGAVHARVTVPVNPQTALIVPVEIPSLPLVTLSEEGKNETRKSSIVMVVELLVEVRKVVLPE
jgi:hypothetical protein